MTNNPEEEKLEHFNKIWSGLTMHEQVVCKFLAVGIRSNEKESRAWQTGLDLAILDELVTEHCVEEFNTSVNTSELIDNLISSRLVVAIPIQEVFQALVDQMKESVDEILAQKRSGEITTYAGHHIKLFSELQNYENVASSQSTDLRYRLVEFDFAKYIHTVNVKKD